MIYGVFILKDSLLEGAAKKLKTGLHRVEVCPNCAGVVLLLSSLDVTDLCGKFVSVIA
jgi:hypothetical protein